MVKNLKVNYGSIEALKGINITVKEGDIVALLGSNGAGKTTLIKLLLGILEASKGKIYLEGEVLNKNTDFSHLSYVPQLMAGVDHFPITVGELVGLNLYKELRGLKKLNEEHKSRIFDALELVGLSEKINELYGNLSGGQRQRVLIAKALISLPEILILDEPTTGIDAKTRQDLFHLLSHLNEAHGITILMITHELQAVEDIIDSVYMIEEGQIRKREKR